MAPATGGRPRKPWVVMEEPATAIRHNSFVQTAAARTLHEFQSKPLGGPNSRHFFPSTRATCHPNFVTLACLDHEISKPEVQLQYHDKPPGGPKSNQHIWTSEMIDCTATGFQPDAADRTPGKLSEGEWADTPD
ncbi:hypothetical protein Bbelb_389180 [Branchiostoma belcheri]|nr:hypothetical protein Bbelb_389180 [Branchiostoma belcheri]